MDSKQQATNHDFLESKTLERTKFFESIMGLIFAPIVLIAYLLAVYNNRFATIGDWILFVVFSFVGLALPFRVILGSIRYFAIRSVFRETLFVKPCVQELTVTLRHQDEYIVAVWVKFPSMPIQSFRLYKPLTLPRILTTCHLTNDSIQKRNLHWERPEIRSSSVEAFLSTVVKNTTKIVIQFDLREVNSPGCAWVEVCHIPTLSNIVFGNKDTPDNRFSKLTVLECDKVISE